MKKLVKKYVRYFFIARNKLRWRLGLTGGHRAEVFVKWDIVKQFQKRGSYRTFIETGTYRGDMVEAVKDRFETIYSIELGEDLVKAARSRFANAPHIKIIRGDSAVELPKLIREIKTDCLFFLDAHYSGGDTAFGEVLSPILKELILLLDRPYRDTILIDDARLFDGVDYPTLGKIKRTVRRKRPELLFEVQDDIIRIFPHD